MKQKVRMLEGEINDAEEVAQRSTDGEGGVTGREQ